MTSISKNFLLIGKSGVGKTATFNSILNKSEPNISSGPIKPDVQSMVTEEGTNVSAIDGLNVIEIREAADFTEVEKALAYVDGISAFLIIMKFGERFTEADGDVILATKAVFGEGVLSRFGICVFTNGDMFKRQVDSGNENFHTIEEWLDEETGKMKEVYEDCQRRVVLFDNKLKIEDKKQNQRLNLFQKVDSMKTKSNSKYTLKEFEDFDGKEKLIQRKRQKDMAADTQTKIKDFRDRFHKMSKEGLDRQGLIDLQKELEKQLLEKECSPESVHLRVLLDEVKSAIGCGNTKIKSPPQKKYDNGQLDVKTASQNEEFITIQLSTKLLSEIEEAFAKFTKLNEELLKTENVAFELKKEIESMILSFLDLQSKLKDARVKENSVHEEALSNGKHYPTNPKSDQGRSLSCNLL
ncbi:unnamed protein product [Lymnaea stagnalis]|uniref:AIG1-type G domain-containing protein n=1 Tax=Lymnaea stagnalis TaxID=6523 RepID=A0AAV2HLH2_LYMST